MRHRREGHKGGKGVKGEIIGLGTGHLLQGGRVQNGKIEGPKLFAPPPSCRQDRVQVIVPPPF